MSDLLNLVFMAVNVLGLIGVMLSAWFGARFLWKKQKPSKAVIIALFILDFIFVFQLVGGLAVSNFHR